MLSPTFRIKTRARPNRGWWVALFSGPLAFSTAVGLRSAGFSGVGVTGLFSPVFAGDVAVFVEVGCFVGEQAPDL